MKKIALIVVVVAVVVYVFGFLVPDLKEKRSQTESTPNQGEVAQDEKGMGGPQGGMPGMGGPMGGMRRNPMEELKDENGNVVIAKIDESKMPDDRKAEMKESMTAADADGDGLLNEEEQKAYEETRRAERMARMFDELKNDEGQYDLSKLEDAKMFPPAKEAAKAADADGDGFLSEEELQAAKDALAEEMAKGPQGMGGPGGPMGGMGGPQGGMPGGPMGGPEGGMPGGPMGGPEGGMPGGPQGGPEGGMPGGPAPESAPAEN